MWAEKRRKASNKRAALGELLVVLFSKHGPCTKAADVEPSFLSGTRLQLNVRVVHALQLGDRFFVVNLLLTRVTEETSENSQQSNTYTVLTRL